MAAALVAGAAAACNNGGAKMGTYGYDVDFFKKNNVEIVELASEDGQSKIILVPAYQGRVMTSTAGGNAGDSYGWINYKFIESGEIDPQFCPFGGEERFWLGPEGGPYSLFFKKGDPQVFANWNVPKIIDTKPFSVTAQSGSSASFAGSAHMHNASGAHLDVGMERTVSLLSRDEAAKLLGTDIPSDLQFVGYQTDNTIKNLGQNEWTKENGLITVWMLGMFNSSPATTVFIPYEVDTVGTVVNSDYFGPMPADRMIVENDMIYFKVDGQFRSKIGVPDGRAKPMCASYDADKKVLTILTCTIPSGEKSYMNAQWGEQADSYNGDVINSYNDGPLEDGSIMGPFYEIESSSPGAALKPAESLTHTQRILHIQGDEAGIAAMVKALFGVELQTITSKFNG